MSAWTSIRAWFGVPAPKKAPERPRHKTVLPPTERAALLKQAMAAHRAGRAHVRDVLERQLKELRAEVLKPGRDPESTARLLSLHQASGTLKRLMTHDLKKFLVLVGIRQLLGEAPKEDDRRRVVSKR